MNDHRRQHRAFAVAVGLAIGLALPFPSASARAAHRTGAPHVTWSTPINHGPLAVAADTAGTIVTTNLGDTIALDRAGRSRWRAAVTTNPSAPAIDGDTAVLAGDARVFAFARGDGRPRWTQALPERGTQAVAAGGVVVVTDAAGALRAFDVVTGTPKWGADFPMELYHEPVIDPDARAVAIIAPGSQEPVLRVLDLDSGALRWEQSVDAYTAVPVIHDGRVFVAEGDGRFHALVVAYDLTSGELVWGAQVRASFEPGIFPAADDDILVVVDHYGHVTALDPRDGSYLWERSLDATVLSTRVALTRHRIALSSAAKDVFVLDRANGRVDRHVTAEQLGGWAVDFTSARFGVSRDRERLLVAVRLGDRERVELWRLA